MSAVHGEFTEIDSTRQGEWSQSRRRLIRLTSPRPATATRLVVVEVEVVVVVVVTSVTTVRCLPVPPCHPLLCPALSRLPVVLPGIEN
ncbi:hypothetical protein E2C01_024413 [Portunus trituberculatus]|uniref:Uncharacterized protein n=1 Tax=Portunus trituberculatus TaxID=210409 RepID=A0A5B7EEM9_PORTR|nr:hypothetical protein [Portunus trituberculatus]